VEVCVIGFVICMYSIIVKWIDKLKFGCIDKVGKKRSVFVGNGRRVMEVTSEVTKMGIKVSTKDDFT